MYGFLSTPDSDDLCESCGVPLSEHRSGRPLTPLEQILALPAKPNGSNGHSAPPWSALGAIPANCWDVPGFKTCADQQFELAREECEAGLMTGMTAEQVAECTRRSHQQRTEQNCVPKLCPPSGSYPWGQSSASTRALQSEINRRIRERKASQGGYGWCEIAEDGVLGPQTCGAANEVYPEGIPSTCLQHRLDWLPPGLCNPQGPVSCPPGQQIVNGRCVTPGALPAPPPPVVKKKSNGALVAGLAALVIGGLVAYAQES